MDLTAEQPPLFRLEKVERRFGSRVALQAIDLTVKPRELILLAGPSGSGKSTLLRLLAGVLRPSAGSVEVEGVDVLSMTPRLIRRHRARCGIVEQGALLVPQLDIHRNVVAGRLAHWPLYRIFWSALWPLEREQVRDALDRVGLADRQWDIASNLSGGQQQRVSIARALISSPSIILADEPTASLDQKTARDITMLLVQEGRRRGATLVFCSHWVSMVMDQVDRVVGVREGQLVLDCAPSDVSPEALDHLYGGVPERQ